jgi:hypothetical protein
MSPERNQSPSANEPAVASGSCQYPAMTFGPWIWISPASPAGSGSPAGSAMRMSVKKCGSPADPALAREYRGCRLVAPGEVSP